MAGELGGGIYAFIKLREVLAYIDAGIVSDLSQNYKNQSSLINDALMTEVGQRHRRTYAQPLIR